MEKGQKIRVTRGKHQHETGTVDVQSGDFPGFYYCWLDRTEKRWRGDQCTTVEKEPVRVLLAKGQLELV